MSVAALATRLILGVLFIYAGTIKILDPGAFLEDILQYRLVGRQIAWAVVVVLPPMEVVFGLALWMPNWYREGALVLGSLMVLFTIAISSAWVRGIDLSCGCFGLSGNAVSSHLWLIVRDLVLLGALGFLVLRTRED